jgi:hypothetical protein
MRARPAGNDGLNASTPRVLVGGDTRRFTCTPIYVGHYEGTPRFGVAAANTLNAIVRASFSPIHRSKQSSRAFPRADIWRARQTPYIFLES